jgi:5-methylcytosine-specific restriction endonuclease McrA
MKPAVRLAVLERDDYRCAYCGARLARPDDLVDQPPLAVVGGWCGCGKGELGGNGRVCTGCPHTRPRRTVPEGMSAPQVDHVVARCNRGSDDPTNLVAACGPCNVAKGGD